MDLIYFYSIIKFVTFNMFSKARLVYSMLMLIFITKLHHIRSRLYAYALDTIPKLKCLKNNTVVCDQVFKRLCPTAFIEVNKSRESS